VARFLAFIVAASVTFSAPAMAGEAEEKRAHALYEAAANDFEARRFEEAIQKLDTAYGLYPIDIILLKKSEALENLGRLGSALETLRSIEEPDERIRGKVVAGIRRLESALSMPVDVSVTSGDVTGARISVDDVDTGKLTPNVIGVSRGAHVIRVEKAGYEPFETEGFIAMGGGMAHIRASLKPRQGHAVIRLNMGTFRDTRVVVDGVDVSVEDPDSDTSSAIEIGVGDHEMICIREGYAAAHQRFSLSEGEGVVLECEIAEIELVITTTDNLHWWLGGAGGTLVIAGGALIASYFDDQAYARDNGLRLVSNKHSFGGALLGLGVVGITTAVMMDSDAVVEEGGEESAWSMLPTRGGVAVGYALRF